MTFNRSDNGGLAFINALESSPVHWWKSRPSGNRHSPGNGGTAEILVAQHNFSKIRSQDNKDDGYLPAINVIDDLLCFTLAVCQGQVLVHPSNYVILESSLDDLMEQI